MAKRKVARVNALIRGKIEEASHELSWRETLSLHSGIDTDDCPQDRQGQSNSSRSRFQAQIMDDNVRVKPCKKLDEPSDRHRPPSRRMAPE